MAVGEGGKGGRGGGIVFLGKGKKGREGEGEGVYVGLAMSRMAGWGGVGME